MTPMEASNALASLATPMQHQDVKISMNAYHFHVTPMHLVPMVEAILTVNVMLDLLVMVSHVKTSMNVILSILAILMPFAAIILVRTLVNVKMVSMVAVLLVMILTSVIKILAIEMPTALILSVLLPALVDRAFMPMVTTVLILTSALSTINAQLMLTVSTHLDHIHAFAKLVILVTVSLVSTSTNVLSLIHVLKMKAVMILMEVMSVHVKMDLTVLIALISMNV